MQEKRLEKKQNNHITHYELYKFPMKVRLTQWTQDERKKIYQNNNVKSNISVASDSINRYQTNLRQH